MSVFGIGLAGENLVELAGVLSAAAGWDFSFDEAFKMGHTLNDQ